MKKYILIFIFTILSTNSTYCTEIDYGVEKEISTIHSLYSNEDQSTESLILNNTQNTGQKIERQSIEKQKEKKEIPKSPLLFYYCGMCIIF